VPARAVCFWALMRRAAAARQVIAGICLAVWLINIPRFNDPLHGGWVRSWPAACRCCASVCASHAALTGWPPTSCTFCRVCLASIRHGALSTTLLNKC